MLRDWLKRQRYKPRASVKTSASEAQVPDLPALRDIYLNLFDVQRSHTLIDVAIDGLDARYQSIILSVDPERGVLEIDELFPTGFVGLPGQPITITVRLDVGRRLTFSTHILSRHDDGQIKSYLLALPDSLDYNQRRGSFRLQLSQGWGVISEFLAPDKEICSARVRDLSSTGIRLEIIGCAPPETGDVLHDLHFEFAGRTYQCAANVRNVTNFGVQSCAGGSASDNAERFLIGAEFLDLSRGEQRSLERMIMQLQRQQIPQVTV
jgi:c-di-GMP-binding flagellar brake protein YcgR